jgi:hypothetical protein
MDNPKLCPNKVQKFKIYQNAISDMMLFISIIDIISVALISILNVFTKVF